MSKGSKQTTTQSIDPLQRQLLSQNYATSMQVADRPFQAYTGERVAGFTPTQTQAQGLFKGIANDTSGQANYGTAINTARGMLDYQPGTVSAPTVSAGMLRDTDLTPYLNPYTQNVIDASLGDLSLARDQQRVADNQSATAAKAWGY